MARCRLDTARLNAAGFTLDSDPNIPSGPALVDQRQAEESHRSRARRLLDEAGVVSLRAPAAAPLQVHARGNRDEIAALLDHGVQEHAEREAKSRKPAQQRTQRGAAREGP
ncbi:hypothetical protein ACFS2C_27470 [Prauserella oleivorans]|uniref:DUF222 domain-containing protein n=1 Tax=Prauserella oleivorans TaxID=1478153 RepID=A0ABW5WJ64_9PSEU